MPDGGQALFSRGYLQNMAHGVVLAVENPAAVGRIYNAADTQALSVRQIAEMVGNIMGHAWEVVPVPRQLLPRAAQTQGLPYSCDPYDIEPHLLLDLTRIRAELGYQDQVNVQEALERTVRWLCENPPQPGPAPDYAALDQAIRKARAVWADV